MLTSRTLAMTNHLSSCTAFVPTVNNSFRKSVYSTFRTLLHSAALTLYCKLFVVKVKARSLAWHEVPLSLCHNKHLSYHSAPTCTVCYHILVLLNYAMYFVSHRQDPGVHQLATTQHCFAGGSKPIEAHALIACCFHSCMRPYPERRWEVRHLEYGSGVVQLPIDNTKNVAIIAKRM
jgi:hypothetical protein